MIGNSLIHKDIFYMMLQDLDNELINANIENIEIFEVGDLTLMYRDERKYIKTSKIYSRNDELFYQSIKYIGDKYGYPNWIDNILKEYNENIPDIIELRNIEEHFDLLNIELIKINIYGAKLGLLLYYNLISKNRGENFKDIIINNDLSKEEVINYIKPYLKFYKSDISILYNRINKCEKYYKNI